MTDPSLNRRQFARQIALGAGAVPLAAITAQTVLPAADTKPADPEPPATPQPAGEKPEPPREPTPEELLLEALIRRYPDERLDGESLGGIFGELLSDAHRSTVLSSFPLQNHDEPAFVFAAWRSDRAGR